MTKRGLALTSETFLDVGGGSVKNGQPHALARIPLRWMIRECFRCHTGIIFDAVLLQSRAGLNIIRGPDGKLALGEVPARIPGAPPPLADSTLKPSFSGRVSSTFTRAHVHSQNDVVRIRSTVTGATLASTTRPKRNCGTRPAHSTTSSRRTGGGHSWSTCPRA